MSKAEPFLYLIGHTEYSLSVRSSEMSLPFGEINNAKKLHKILKNHNIPVSEIYDIYELFGIEDINSSDAALLREMIRINMELASINQEIITDFHHPLTNVFRKRP